MTAARQVTPTPPRAPLVSVQDERAESLAQLIRQVQATTSIVDPRDLAVAVIAEISPADTRDMLAVTLPEYVRQVMNAGRRRSTGSTPGPSAKVAAVRSWHARLMASPIDVAGDGSRWKELARCTREDLLAVAQHRRETAARNLAMADRYKSLASLLTTDSTVGDLPVDVVQNVFGRSTS